MSLTEKQHIGNKGEDIAANFLRTRGFEILDRNYRKKWGELDIVARESSPAGESGGVLHFVEVKTVSRGTFEDEDYSPEDNVHHLKRKRLARAIETYMLEKKVPQETPFQIDVISVYVSRETDKYEIDCLEDIVL
jgi:putative endonuclease